MQVSYTYSKKKVSYTSIQHVLAKWEGRQMCYTILETELMLSVDFVLYQPFLETEQSSSQVNSSWKPIIELHLKPETKPN